MEQLQKELESLLNEGISKGYAMSCADLSRCSGVTTGSISKYIREGLIEYIQQGPQKLISLEDCFFVSIIDYLTKNFQCSYTMCKIVKGLMKISNFAPQEYSSVLEKAISMGAVSDQEIQKNKACYQKLLTNLKPRSKKNA